MTSENKTRQDVIVPVGAAIVAGMALWISRGSLDVAGTTAVPERVAMLPSLAELAGLVVLTLLFAAGIAALLRHRDDRRSFWGPVRPALLPLFGLSFLLLPYLPWLADWLPALRLFAGPGRWLMWLVVIGQVLWLILPDLAKRFGFSPLGVNPAHAGWIFACAAVFLSAPFVLNARVFPHAFAELVGRVRELPSARLSTWRAGTLGVVFDQEFGITLYAPVLLLAFVGLAGMVRERWRRPLGALLVLASVALLALPGAVDPWWHRSMMPGRPVLLLLPFLVPPIAWLYARTSPASLSRAGMQCLLLVSIAITLSLALQGQGAALAQQGDGVSSFLRGMSPTWQLWHEAPSYVAGAERAASIRVVVWLGALGFAAWIFSRREAPSAGHAALWVTATVAVLSVAVVSATAAFASNQTERFDVEGRGLFPLLETFDPLARPIALRYNPFSVARPDELPPVFVLSAVPGQRTGRQPVRVVLNTRFRLPAGSYTLELKGAPSQGVLVPPAAIGLQIGREGRPIETWRLALAPGERIRQTFEVPLDAEFVGFRAARHVEAAIAELRVSPVRVVEMRKRFPTATVLSAAAFEPATVFFHDGHAYPEPSGFWVSGRASARMTVMKPDASRAAMTIDVHSGARPNAVALSTGGWSHTLALTPGVTERVVVPSKEGDRFISLTIGTSEGFVPAEIEQSRDRRLLGAWVAFVSDD
ncbi:MAG TPA: hypothetical protein VJM31_15525 [Vicinamibacterales bacterium]|nr:hypothetical protein [Vicinamibacterales bacterium]